MIKILLSSSHHLSRDSASSSSSCPHPDPVPRRVGLTLAFAPLSRSTSHDKTAKQHPELEIVHPRDAARISSTNTLPSDDLATSEYVIHDVSVSSKNDSPANPPRQSNQTLGERPGSDFDMRVHDYRDPGPPQVCPSVRPYWVYIFISFDIVSPPLRVLPDALHLRYPVCSYAARQRRPSSSPPLPQLVRRPLPVRTSSSA